MNLEAMTDDALTEIAARSRRSIVSIGYDAGGQGAHFGPALSLVEIMTALYGIAVRHLPTDRLSPDRDRVVLSKGHGSLALYSVLHEYGYIDAALLATAEKDGSPLPGQPIRNRELGIEFSSGSLGMGLSFGVGLALSARMMASNRSIYVVMGDGETNEGSTWEAAMSAAHFGLTHLTAIVDVNNLQSNGLTSEVMSCNHRAIWAGFGWDVMEIDGHSFPDLRESLFRPASSRPRCILAHTTKGKGVSFMEGAPDWHHGRLTEAQFERAAQEVRLRDWPQ
ncbi:MAG TPA: transketolase [Actinobacteria bacterium]|nr:transketolase 2 [bacterium BMS3Bbin01]HDH25116.1 transketolase [Actinomycetota bacterium]